MVLDLDLQVPWQAVLEIPVEVLTKVASHAVSVRGDSASNVAQNRVPPAARPRLLVPEGVAIADRQSYMNQCPG